MEFDEEQIGEYKNSLTGFFSLFTLSTKQSSKVALLESFYVVYEKLGVCKAITQNVMMNVLENQKYIDNARQGTVKMKSMNERWKTVYEIWAGNDEYYY